MAEKEIKIKSALPYYAFGTVWVLYSLFFRLYRPADLILCLSVSMLAAFVVSRFAPIKTIVVETVDFEKSGDTYADEVIAKGQAMLRELSQLKSLITKKELQRDIAEIYKTGGQIYEYVSKNPKQAPVIRKFNLYYFPETLKILNAYVNFSDIGSSGKNATDTLRKIESTVGSMSGVFAKQLDTLLHNEAFDVQTDIETLEKLLREEDLRIGGSKRNE